MWMWLLYCLSGSIRIQYLHLREHFFLSVASFVAWLDFLLLDSLNSVFLFFFHHFSRLIPFTLPLPHFLRCHPFAFPTILSSICSPASPLSPSLCLPVSSGRDVGLGRCLRRSLLSQTVRFHATHWNSQIWVLSCKNSWEKKTTFPWRFWADLGQTCCDFFLSFWSLAA